MGCYPGDPLGKGSLYKWHRHLWHLEDLEICCKSMIVHLKEQAWGVHSQRVQGTGAAVEFFAQPWKSHPFWVQTFQCNWFRVSSAQDHNPSPTLCKPQKLLLLLQVNIGGTAPWCTIIPWKETWGFSNRAHPHLCFGSVDRKHRLFNGYLSLAFLIFTIFLTDYLPSPLALQLYTPWGFEITHNFLLVTFPLSWESRSNDW